MLFKNVRIITYFWKVESFVNFQLQNYSKWVPSHGKLLNENELFDVDLGNTTQPLPELKNKTKSRIRKNTNQLHTEEICNEKLFGSENVLEKSKKNVNTKLYENEKLMTSIMMSLVSKKQRKKNDQILLEGKRVIEDAIEAGIKLETLIFSRWEDVKDLSFSKSKTQLYKVPYRSIQLWSTLTTSPGVMGIFTKPAPKKPTNSSLPITIICDNIRDPGNLGSILRAAAGVGCEKVILTKGCVDFWDSKVLRSATGAHFRVPVYGSQNWDDINCLISEDARVYIADNNADCNIQSYDTKEANEEPSIEDDINLKEKTEDNDSLRSSSDFPVVPYYSVDYTQTEVIIIVGGETEGLSQESFQLVENRKGVRVNIPLANQINSLNSGMALGVVAFEVKRQYLSIKNKIM